MSNLTKLVDFCKVSLLILVVNSVSVGFAQDQTTTNYLTSSTVKVNARASQGHETMETLTPAQEHQVEAIVKRKLQCEIWNRAAQAWHAGDITLEQFDKITGGRRTWSCP